MTTPANVNDLLARIDGLTSEVARLSSDLSDLAAVMQVPIGEASEPRTAAASAPTYASLDEWVDEYFLVVFNRTTGGDLRWCPEWRKHPEAVTRLEALWRSWEVMRSDPNLGVASWLVGYLDPLLGALLARQGAFAGCTPTRHGEDQRARMDSDRDGRPPP